jgi:hypothetical protein
MSRRFAGIGGLRRAQRDAAPTRAFIRQLQFILGSLLVEVWDSQSGIVTVSNEADTWTGQIRGTILSAPTSANRPPYAADSTFFGGKPVVKCDLATTRYMTAAGLSSLAATGTFPWATSRYRHRVTGEGQAAVFIFDSPTQSLDFTVMTDGTGVSFRRFGMPLTALDIAGLDTAVHTGSTWNDGVNRSFKIDATTVTSATAVGCTANFTQASIGASQSASNKATASIASVVLCSAYPGASAAAATEALIASRYPA